MKNIELTNTRNNKKFTIVNKFSFILFNINEVYDDNILIIEKDTNKMKVGNGLVPYRSLNYINLDDRGGSFVINGVL